ncbi:MULTISPECIES: MazG-like family protein [unclassified Sulfitobacter]|uniref:MazG-like family protein n=1 Tax=unclassified Sulfitobacter TaxID=196795 RepID=UPI003746BC89
MDLSKIAQIQIEADVRRGFSKELRTDAERIEQLMRDTVGLAGEVGEFANLLKKADLTSRIEGYDGVSIDAASAELREELADAMIYIIRLASALGGDIESELLKKISKNDERYRHLEK